jgi:hypothetical protein
MHEGDSRAGFARAIISSSCLGAFVVQGNRTDDD